MTARRLLVLVHGMLVESHGQEEVDKMLGPATPEPRGRTRARELAGLGVEVG